VKPRSIIGKVATVSAASLILTACFSKPIVGVLLPSTGAAASYGESMKEGIDRALEEAVT
jgi:hypothetical protein